MLAIEVAFLTGRYVATSFDDREQAEWPPHPARLFSALTAAHFEALDPRAEEREALLWLEQQGAPEIAAPEASRRDAVTVFVPVNDTSVIGTLDDEAAALAEARAAMEAARAKGGKALAAAERKLAKADEAIRKAVAAVPAGKEGKAGPGEAASLLPERRGRQPRRFPSLTPEAPGVVFTWSSAEPPPAIRAALDALTARVVRLGHSSSLVSMRLGDQPSAATWIPAAEGAGGPGGTVLRVVVVGQLQSLCDAFARAADSPGRVMPATFQRYVRPSASVGASTLETVFDDEEWIVLRRVDGPRLPSTQAVEVARRVRDALMLAFGPGAPEILSGHRSAGVPSERPHLAYVPLPRVGDEWADGTIMGVALVLPRGTRGDERRAVFQALGKWEGNQREEMQKRRASGAVVIGDEDTPRLPVHLGRSGTLWLERAEGVAAQATLRAPVWCAPSLVWASATPVALDRNPGDLRAPDAKKEAEAYAAAEESIARACTWIGLPRPARVTVLPAAPLVGADKARHFPAFKSGGVQRVLVHVTMAFDTPVRGPVLLGAGRYFGLGLLRPVRDHV